MTDITVEPERASLTRQFEARQVVQMPWFPKAVRLGALFHSRHVGTDDPFSKIPLFDQKSLDNAKAYFSRYTGSDTYKSIESSSSSISSEHMSISVGASLDCKIAKVSGSYQYDKDNMENRDANKTSINIAYRAGSITFRRAPKLSTEITTMLESGVGLRELQSRCGDYYVGGYILGADVGLMISQSSSSSYAAEHEHAEIKVEFLIWEDTTSWDKSSSSSSGESRFSLSGYYSLDNTRLAKTLEAKDAGLGSLLPSCSGIVQKFKKVESEVDKKMKELGVMEDKVLDAGTCERISQSGVAVQIILIPIETLREIRMQVKAP